MEGDVFEIIQNSSLQKVFLVMAHFKKVLPFCLSKRYVIPCYFDFNRILLILIVQLYTN